MANMNGADFQPLINIVVFLGIVISSATLICLFHIIVPPQSRSARIFNSIALIFATIGGILLFAIGTFFPPCMLGAFVIFVVAITTLIRRQKMDEKKFESQPTSENLSE